MRIAQRGLQHDAVVGVRLDRESKQTPWREHAGRRGSNRGEIVEIDENIGGENKVIVRASIRLSVEKIPQVGHSEPIVNALRTRLPDHGR